MALADDLDVALRSAPQVQKDPTLGIAAVTAGGDVQQNVEVASHVLNQQAVHQAVDETATKHGGHGVFGATLGWLGSGVKGALDVVGNSVEKVGHIANMGLSEVQHQYRYLRDVQDQHGSAAALLEGIVMAGVGVTAAAATGGNISVGILAAEGAGSVLGRLQYHDSWARTNSATYVDRHGGQPVSPGRDFARALGSLSKHVGVHIEQHAGFDLYDAISGAGDGLFDIAADPLARGLAIKHAATTEVGLGGLLSRWGGTAAKADNIDKAYQTYGSVRRAMNELATLDAGQIVSKYKKFTPMAAELGEAKTAKEVGQVFVNYANAGEMAGRTLPRLTQKAEFLGKVVEAGKTYEGIGSTAIRRARTFVPSSLDPITGKMSRELMNFGAADSARTVYDLALQGGTEGRAQLMAKQWINSNIVERTHLYRNVLTENLANRMEEKIPGWATTAEGQEHLLEYADRIDEMMGGVDGGRIMPWGYDKDGRIISTVMDKGTKVSIPILENQSFYAKLPDYLDFDRTLKALGNGSEMYGKVDDFLYDHFTQNVFKKWVLATGGFALRVASGEIVPQLLGHPAETLKAKIGSSLAKNAWKVSEGESENIMAPIVRAMASGMRMSDEEIAFHANRIKMHGGESVAAAVDAGHSAGERIIGTKEWNKRELARLNKEVPIRQRVTEETAGFGPEQDDHHLYWHSDVTNTAKSPATQAAAKAYRDAIDEVPGRTLEGAAEFEATHRASLAAKGVLDTLPEEHLNQLPRHFQSTVDERVPGVVDTTVRRWVPGTPAQRAVESEFIGSAEHTTPGHWEVVGEHPVGQFTTQRALANPAGNVPGGLRGPGSVYSDITGAEAHPRPGSPDAIFEAAVRAKRTAIPLKEAGPAPQGTLAEHARHIKGEVVPAETYGKTVQVPEPGTPRSKTPHSFLEHEDIGPVVAPERQAGFEGMGPQAQGITGENVVVTPGERMEVLLEQQKLGMPEVAPDPHHDWSRVMVENLKGKVYGQDGTLHREVLDALAEGRAPNLDVLKAVPMESRPAKILGSYEMPAAPDKLSDKIFRTLNGTIKWIAREPLYAKASWSEFQYLKPLVDEGVLTYDEAVSRASSRAINKMLPHVHNINERTLLAEHSRNFVPFMFAQQQSYARMFRLLADDPVAFRRMQLAYTKLADFGGIYDDGSGNHQVVMPGLGWLTGKAISAMGMANIPVVNSIPTAFGGNLKSLASLSPFLEAGELIRPGPLVAMPLRLINNILPETKALTTPIVGEQSQGQPFWAMMVPNSTMRNLMSTIIPIDNRTQAKSVLDAIQALEYKQNVEMTKYLKKNPEPEVGTAAHDDWEAKQPHYVPGPDATDMQIQTFKDRLKNHARILTMMKGIVGAFSPIAPSIQVGDTKLKTELYDAIKKDGISVAIQDFLHNNPDATPYTVFETDAGAASPISSNHPAQQWVRDNLSFVTSKKYSTAASYFVPQSDDPFSQEVYNEQMAMGLRIAKSPEQLIRDIHTSEGNRWYFDTYKPAKDAAVAKANSPHERNAITHQFSTVGGKDLQGNPVQSLDSMKLDNPMWYSNFSSGERDVQRQLAITQMQQAITTGDAPSSPMKAGITALLQDFEMHQRQMLTGRTDSYASAQRTQEKKNWQNHLKSVATDQPELAMVINNVFRGV